MSRSLSQWHWPRTRLRGTAAQVRSQRGGQRLSSAQQVKAGGCGLYLPGTWVPKYPRTLDPDPCLLDLPLPCQSCPAIASAENELRKSCVEAGLFYRPSSISSTRAAGAAQLPPVARGSKAAEHSRPSTAGCRPSRLYRAAARSWQQRHGGHHHCQCAAVVVPCCSSCESE